MSDKPTLGYVQDMMTGKYVFRENGAQRAQRRAARKGLTVGAPVRIHYNVPPRQPQPGTYWRKGGPGTGVALERIDRMARYLLQRDVTTHVRHGVNWQPTPRQRRRLDKKARQSSYRKLLESQRLDNPAGYALAMTDTRGPAASAVVVDEPPRVPMVHTVGRQTEHGPIEPPQFMEPGARRQWPVVPSWVEPPPIEEVNPTPRERAAMSRGFRVVDRRGEHRS